MDQDDPEQRIGDLEHQLADTDAAAREDHVVQPPPRSFADDESAVSRRFVAHPPMRFTTVLKLAMLSLILPVGLLVAVVAFPRYVAAEGLVFFIGSFVVGGLYLLWIVRKRLIISVTNDGMTVDKRPGEVFSFGDAQLGPWTQKGYGDTTKGRTAIHLRCGPHRFVLGGRARHIAPGTSLEAPPVDSVDAFTTSREFDVLLAMVDRQRR